MATVDYDNVLQIWDQNGQLLASKKIHTEDVNNISFSPDGEMIVSASDDGTVKLWNTQGELLETFTEHNGEVVNGVFTPDGEMIASASFDDTIKLWNLDGQLITSIASDIANVGNTFEIYFHPDGSHKRIVFDQ